MNKKNKFIEFVLCIENKDCDDLEKRKVYAVKPDSKAEEDGYLRIIDESGEDYLYPKTYFTSIQFPQELQDSLFVKL
ncbi:MAG: hypothetical protein IT276_07130 [Ignavibacteriaceae bacterium]|nr:hypothetical protein [Ignavibacterium sp.]MCC6254668.1 hypothetical protein [Ignavibacteriaceae bacterium]HRN25216.1 hypothetical protein [Ignavibacteriaceae bacterium]HRQ52950.1 hypothetical protein [Ignavibacteriaceae bacterium]